MPGIRKDIVQENSFFTYDEIYRELTRQRTLSKKTEEIRDERIHWDRWKTACCQGQLNVLRISDLNNLWTIFGRFLGFVLRSYREGNLVGGGGDKRKMERKLISRTKVRDRAHRNFSSRKSMKFFTQRMQYGEFILNSEMWVEGLPTDWIQQFIIYETSNSL